MSCLNTLIQRNRKLPSCLGFLFSVVFFESLLLIFCFFEVRLEDFGVDLGVTEFSLDGGRFGVLGATLLGEPNGLEA